MVTATTYKRAEQNTAPTPQRIDPSELLAKLANFEKELEKELIAFKAQKIQIISAFENVYKHYNTLTGHIPELSANQTLFISSLQKTESIEELNDAIAALIGTIAKQETLAKITKNKFSLLLTQKSQELRVNGDLPGKDHSQSILAIHTEVANLYDTYFKKYGDTQFSQQLLIFKNKIHKSGTLEDIENCFSEIKAWITSQPLPGMPSPGKRMTELLYGSHTVLDFEKVMDELKDSLVRKKLLIKAVPSEALKKYKEEVDHIKIQLTLFREEKIAEATEIIKDNVKEIERIANINFPEDIGRSLKENILELRRVFNDFKTDSKDDANLEAAIVELKTGVSLFWRSFIEKADQNLSSSTKQKKQLKKLRSHILHSRSTLIGKKILVRDHKSDTRFIMLERLEKHYKNVVKGSWVSVGKDRQHQLEVLNTKIHASESTADAVNAIEEALFEIKMKHETESLAYNILSLRRASRTVLALENLLGDLEASSLISKPKKMISDKLEKSLDVYFSTDMFVNSRLRQKVKFALLSEIRTIEKEQKEEKCTDQVAKERIREKIESTITVVSGTHEKGEGFSKTIRLLGYKNGSSRFCEHLRNFITSQNLPEPYIKAAWPNIRKILHNKISPLYSLPGMFENRKENGLEVAGSLIDRLEHAGSADCAAYLLHVSIQSMAETQGYETVVKVLTEGEADLHASGLLRNTETSEFTDVYLGQAQTKFEEWKEELRTNHAAAKQLKVRVKSLGTPKPPPLQNVVIASA